SIGGILGYCNNNDILLWHCFNGVAVQAYGALNVGGIVGQNKSHQAGLQWCFYVDEMCQGNGDNGRGQKVTAEQFAAGYVTYMLNEEKSPGSATWRQDVGLDQFPTRDSGHGVVYKVVIGDTVGDVYYSNDPNTPYINGINARNPDDYQPPVLNDQKIYEIS